MREYCRAYTTQKAIEATSKTGCLYRKLTIWGNNGAQPASRSASG